MKTAVKDKLRRLTCMLLALAMTLSLCDVLDLSGIALAAPPDPATANVVNTADASNKTKPKLYIDFLGDTTSVYGSSTDTSAPTQMDQSASQSGSRATGAGTWNKYGSGDMGKVFWVGVGIDKMSAFELSKNGGLTGLELGFYYNTTYVEPYTNGNYAATLAGANLASSPKALNQWDSGVYHIEEAVTGLAPVVDETQELFTANPIHNPDIPSTSELTAANSTWRMAYVSLERTMKADDSDWISAAPNRFASGPFNAGDIYYVMMLPFVVKAYDSQDRVCFRLSRNASAFSMGGSTYGAGTYGDSNAGSGSFGAWERATQTPNHNLKTMFDFEGDLNIFKGQNESDQFFKVDLSLKKAQSGDAAVLYPSDDESIYVKANDGSTTATLQNLTQGRQVTLKIAKRTNATASVSITTSSGSIPYTTVTAQEEYTFVMPQADVLVEVEYTTTTQQPDDYKARLVIVDPDGVAQNTADMSGTKSDGSSDQTQMPTKDTMLADPGSTVTIAVQAHPDYKATVNVETWGGISQNVTAPANLDTTGNYTFTMPSSDVVTTVTYTKWDSYIAELAVHQDNTPNGNAGNKATLSFMDYSTSVSGVKQSVSIAQKDDPNDHLNLGPIPETREVRLDIDLVSGYMVSQVLLYEKYGNNSYSTTYQNLTPNLVNPTSTNPYLTFHMPNHAVEVYVVFARLQNFDAQLKLISNTQGAATMSGNKDALAPGGTLQTVTVDDVNNTTNPSAKIPLWPGNTITVKITPKTDYQVKAIKIKTDDPFQPTISYIDNLSTNGEIEFLMPGANVVVEVTFEDVPKDKHNLTLKFQPDNPASYNLANTGWPDNPAAMTYMDYPTIYNVVVGTTQTAWVDVQAGWHIASVKVLGVDESPMGTGTGSGISYPILSISGNGYNNGNGGKVVIEVNEPPEDATVYVELKKGPPDPEPKQGLRLMVNDPDNKANNWAKVSVNNGAAIPGSGVTSTYNGGNGYTVSNIIGGDQVDVTWNLEPDYYVSKVEVTPSSHGIIPTWISPNSIQFNQPAGPATVTVYFKKIDPANPPYVARIHTINADASETATLSSNNNSASPQATTENNTNTASQPIPAWPMDIFTTSASLNTHTYALVEVYQGGNLVAWTATGNGTAGAGTFTMPGGNVDVYVEFTNTLPPATNRRLTLTAYGPAGTNSGDAGVAELYVGGTGANTVDGTLKGTANSNDVSVKEYVTIGDTVKISAKPKAGYIVDYITYSPGNTVTPVTLLAPAGVGSQAVSFAMPANAQSVVVHFKKGTAANVDKHMANITIWPPSGVSVSAVGDAQFADLNTGNLKGYSVSEPAGTGLRVKAYANNGYYIKKIEITPASLGIFSPLTGVFASQTVDFVMPNADCTVNVYYEKGWPNSLYATLNVHGPTVPANTNSAEMSSVNATPTTTGTVTPGGSGTLTTIAPGDVVKVQINVDPSNPPGYTLVYPVSVKDSFGATIPYWWSGTGEISFYMPGTWVVVDVNFEEGVDPYSNLKATLMDTSGYSKLSLPTAVTGATVTNNLITGLHPGNEVEVTIKPSGLYTGKVPVVTVFGDPSHTAIATAALVFDNVDTYTTSFFMQQEDAEVHISYVTQPGTDEHIANLIVTQSNGVLSGGDAEMYWKNTTSKTTGTVSSVDSGSVAILKDELVEIKVAPNTTANPNFVIQSVVVTRNDTGATVPVTPTGMSGSDYLFEYTMPDAPVTAVVTFREKTAADDKLTAQIVVNNAGDNGNQAFIRKYTDSASNNTNYLSPLSVGEHITVDITSVAPGYEVEFVMVSPTKGIAYTIPLPLLSNLPQAVDFYMPADDVIVYVKFKTDGIKRYNISLTVEEDASTPPTYTNTAHIHTAFSGPTSPDNKHNDPASWVKGAVNEVVTVTINPDSGYYAVVTAVSSDSSKTPVSNLTLHTDGVTYTFSVPSNDVDVLVKFYKKSVVPPTSHQVTLHEIVLNTASGSSSVFQTITPGNITTLDGGTITVPYLDHVSVSATATTGYIVSAYAKMGNVVLPMINPQPASPTVPMTNRTFDFMMQNGNVDVYIVYDDSATPPHGPYSVALSVTGPTGETKGAAGSAKLSRDGSSDATSDVESNESFHPVNHVISGAQGDAYTVRVKVNPGYVIDTFVVTPLTKNVKIDSVSQDPNTKEWIYKFKMPNPPADLAVNVTLKKDNSAWHTVTLKELTDAYMTANPSATTSVNKAKVTYTVYTLKQQGDTMQVPEAQLVTIEVEPGSGYYVHHAYAVGKSGKVQLLKQYGTTTPQGLQNLQNPNTGKVQFEMPKEDVDVYIKFEDVNKPKTGDYSAVLTVFDSTNSGQSKGLTLTNDTLNPKEVTKADSDGVTSFPAININVGDKLIVDWTGKLATGYAVDTVTVTGLPTGDVTLTFGANDTFCSYNVPNPGYDLGIIVKLKSAPVTGYTATLHIVDHSSAIGNQVAMKSGATTVNTDGAKISNINNGAVVSTTVTPQPTVDVRAVMVTDDKGTRLLKLVNGKYDYPIAGSNADITVVLDNKHVGTDPDPMYVAMVTRTGETAPVGNKASVVNTSNPALPKGNFWTGIYQTHSLRVDVETDTGDTYYVSIIARNASGPTGFSQHQVLQLGVTGKVTGYLNVPAALAENIVIEVNYSKAAPTATPNLKLEMAGGNNSGSNTSKIEDSNPTTILSVDGSPSNNTAGPVQVTVGEALTLTNAITVGYLKEITLEQTGVSGGVKIKLPLDTGNFAMPTSDAKVTVVVETGPRTPRPFDSNQDPAGGTSHPEAIDGYLLGQNLSKNRAVIQVPKLRDATGNDFAAFDEPNSKYYQYTLYVKNGEGYTKLVKGLDYEIIAWDSYDPTVPNLVSATPNAHTDTGWRFTIRSLKGESALTELLLTGTTDDNRLYITATEVDANGNPTGADESELVDVILPADANKGKYTATLHIVDNSGISGNKAEMNVKGTTVNSHGASVPNLDGDELIRTVVAPAAGARVTAVTVTDSAGTRLLDKVPSGTMRFPYYMTGEDVIITVYFEGDPATDPLPRYIAAVTKMGAMGVPGNDATIKNDDRSDLAKGVIWAEGNPTNDMRVTVSLAKGYYATVEAYRKDNPSVKLTVTAFGIGPGSSSGPNFDTFDAIFQMPGVPCSDVQVIVTYYKEVPPGVDPDNQLTLVMAGSFGNTANNKAELKEQSPGTLDLKVDALGTQIQSSLPTKVTAGTKFDLTTGHDSGYYIKWVKAYIPNKANPVSTISIPLDASGGAVFTMPLGEAVVEVFFADVTSTARTARPYDPIHSVEYNGTNYPSTITDESNPTQEGWIEAVPMSSVTVSGNKTQGRIEVTVPTLHDDDSTNSTIANHLSNAGAPTNQPAADYTLYWKDSYGTYQKLTKGTDYTLSAEVEVPNAYSSHTGYQFVLTAVTPGSMLDYILKNGGQLYITATTPGGSPGESDYTQIIVPRYYIATLYYLPNGTAVMYGGSVTSASPITADGGSITKLKGNETITVDTITPDTNPAPGYVLVGVVATTDVGSVNATKVNSTQYTYQMVQKDVDLKVVFNKADDPLNSKGPRMVTVLKKGDDGLTGNKATVEDKDVTIPSGMWDDPQKRWTAAYTGNVIQVDMTAESGYYVKSVTAVEKNRTSGSPVTIQVLQYGSYALFYMPADVDVDVTVEYAKGTAPTHKLTLELLNAGGNPDNKATITYTGNSLNTDGFNQTTDSATGVAADTILKLTTAADATNSWSVEKVEMVVGGITVDIPMTDGKALPDFKMPFTNADVKVTFQNKDQMPRPYDPNHANYYTSTYNHNTADDLSSTHQDGWIRGGTTSADSFTIIVPTLHDMSGPGGSHKLVDAAQPESSYRLYWRDHMGNFQLFTSSDITISGGMVLQDYYTDSTPTDYDAYRFNIKLKSPQTLWGGYKLAEYLANGGSIYISAVDSAKGESEKTEVVLTAKTYTAKLTYLPNGVTPNGATMTCGTKSTQQNNGTILDLVGNEIVTVSAIAKPTKHSVLGVVAITSTGAVNVAEDTNYPGEYPYQMAQEDVELHVVYREDDDPLRSKGPYIVTVKKVKDDGEADNKARVDDIDVVIPNGQKDANGTWTAAYEGNVVKVDVGFANGYYAIITATEKATGNSVSVATFAKLDSANALVGCYGLFYMPAWTDVDVTVTYVKGTAPKYELTLKVQEDGTAANSPNNKAQVEITYPGSTYVDTTLGAVDCSIPSPAANATDTGVDNAVPAGSALKLTTGVATSTPPVWSVKSVTMDVNGTKVDVPLTDGVSLPIPVMPFNDAVIEVTFWNLAQTPRPYDPNRANYYNSNYNHKPAATSDPADESSTHQDGWIKGETLGADSFSITVPTLHDMSGAGNTHKLHNADTASYTIYWKDSMGKFWPISEGTTVPGDDVARTGDVKVGKSYTYTNNSTSTDYDGRKLTFKVNIDTNTPQIPTLWGGYTLLEYLSNGGSIWITATNGGAESEKTEVVLEAGNALRPYDPDNTNNSNYDDHWIRAENRADYLLVTVPILNRKDGSVPTKIDGDIHRLQLHLQDDASKKTDPTTMVNVTHLMDIIHVKGYQITGSGELNNYYDETWSATPNYLFEDEYENDVYWKDPSDNDKPYNGARFVVVLKSKIDPADYAVGSYTSDGTQNPDYIKDLGNWTTLKAIFNNMGTMASTTPHRMYITCDSVAAKNDPLPAFTANDYVDFEVPVYYTVKGVLEAYAPQHDATFEFYKEGATANDPPTLEHSFRMAGKSRGKGLYQQSFELKSSELMDKWILKVKKVGHVTYEQPTLELKTAWSDKSGELTFTLVEKAELEANTGATTVPDPTPIVLIGGDVNGDGKVTMVDRETVLRFAENGGYTKETNKANTATWAESVYNPASLAYAADLDGSRTINMMDLAVVMAERNVGKTDAAYDTPVYVWKTPLASVPVGLTVIPALTEEEMLAQAREELTKLVEDAMAELTETKLPVLLEEKKAELLAAKRKALLLAQLDELDEEMRTALTEEDLETMSEALEVELTEGEVASLADAILVTPTEEELDQLVAQIVASLAEETRDALTRGALAELSDDELLEMSEEDLDALLNSALCAMAKEVISAMITSGEKTEAAQEAEVVQQVPELPETVVLPEEEITGEAKLPNDGEAEMPEDGKSATEAEDEVSEEEKTSVEEESETFGKDEPTAKEENKTPAAGEPIVEETREASGEEESSVEEEKKTPVTEEPAVEETGETSGEEESSAEEESKTPAAEQSSTAGESEPSEEETFPVQSEEEMNPKEEETFVEEKNPVASETQVAHSQVNEEGGDMSRDIEMEQEGDQPPAGVDSGAVSPAQVPDGSGTESVEPVNVARVFYSHNACNYVNTVV